MVSFVDWRQKLVQYIQCSKNVDGTKLRWFWKKEKGERYRSPRNSHYSRYPTADKEKEEDEEGLRIQP